MSAWKPNYKFGLWLLVALLLVINVDYWTIHHRSSRPNTKHSSLNLTYNSDHVPYQGTLLTAFSGQTDRRSSEFQATADWHVYWTFECLNETQAGMLKIDAYDANEKVVGQSVDAKGISGYGDQVYHESGKFTLKVQTLPGCSWKVSVKKLSI